MHLWSEEERSGTLEILFSLPLKVHRIGVRKIFSGLGVF
ncbi:hypothetical protein LEP1GSC150_3599 [Leptospira interrogans serovar Copenhageni str. LT2050]|uniref:Uncharacterized protein n=1 Tax=Leptospira interrogans serovar Copenhageni str. LT2050 TaxID=1001598 RepID=M3IQL0_LEPIT|nr:hypothetical protein LEP1GSC150_3599 [Leptospira interrogans serovar Copenhageni str. LT2050]